MAHDAWFYATVEIGGKVVETNSWRDLVGNWTQGSKLLKVRPWFENIEEAGEFFRAIGGNKDLSPQSASIMTNLLSHHPHLFKKGEDVISFVVTNLDFAGAVLFFSNLKYHSCPAKSMALRSEVLKKIPSLNTPSEILNIASLVEGGQYIDAILMVHSLMGDDNKNSFMRLASIFKLVQRYLMPENFTKFAIKLLSEALHLYGDRRNLWKIVKLSSNDACGLKNFVESIMSSSELFDKEAVSILSTEYAKLLADMSRVKNSKAHRASYGSFGGGGSAGSDGNIFYQPSLTASTDCTFVIPGSGSTLGDCDLFRSICLNDKGDVFINSYKNPIARSLFGSYGRMKKETYEISKLIVEKYLSDKRIMLAGISYGGAEVLACIDNICDIAEKRDLDVRDIFKKNGCPDVVAFGKGDFYKPRISPY